MIWKNLKLNNMKKIISEVKQLTIDNIVEQLESSNNIIVFYRSHNEREGVPVFLKKLGHRDIGFVNPINNYSTCYRNTTFRLSLEAAAKSRTLYVINKEEASELFKIQPTI